MIGTYVGLHFIRFFCILSFWPVLRLIGYGMSFKQVVLCSYAGLRGAVGLSLALMVAGEEKLPKYSRDVILLHVAGVALLTLLINATTTSWVINKLGLSRQSDIKKNILISISYQLENQVDQNIEILKQKRHFNNVDWITLKKNIEMTDLKKKFKRYRNLHLDGDVDAIG